MKTYLRVQQDLEDEDFVLVGGKWWANDYRTYEWKRQEKNGSYTIVSVRHYGPGAEGEEPEDWEDEFEFQSLSERDRAFRRWLREELEAERVRRGG